MKISRFHVSAHAVQRSRERGIGIDVMKSVVHYPTAQRQQRRGPNGGWVYAFTQRHERETIEVIAEVKKGVCWLLTAYRI